ncbi:MAG: serine/threonine protein kinase [Eubacterium sp.]|nr:serine/threonine protein kinase [Eubacterium sp.]
MGVEVAVKEYFPKNVARRTTGIVVNVSSEEDKDKFLQGKDRFLNEARNLAQFNGNQGIVTIYDYFEENYTAYIVMEYLKGQNISQYMKYLNGIPDYSFTAYIADKICDILQKIHEEGIIHRDLSPDNIFLCEDGEVKLIDFGAVARRNDSVIDTQVLVVILKPGYTPAEQYNTSGNIGPWSDIYALGATLYKMTTGNVPQESILRQNRDDVVPPHTLNPAIPYEFSMAIMQALNIDLEKRFSSAQDFKNALFQNATPSQELQITEYNVAPVYDAAIVNGMGSGVLTGTSVLMSSDNYFGTDVLAQTGGLYGYLNSPYYSANKKKAKMDDGTKFIIGSIITLASILVVALVILLIIMF